MRLASRLLRGARASWSQPPFWESDRLALPLLSTSPLKPSEERIGNSFEGYVHGAYKSNGPIFACIVARQWVFSEARFQFRRFVDGRPGELFGDASLQLLERPSMNETTGELLARMEQDASLAGNFWATRADDAGRLGAAARGDGLRVVRMRPDRVTMVIGSRSGNPNALDARVLGVMYKAPPAEGFPEEETLLLPGEVVHYSPIPDPAARFRGMSWLTPLIKDIESDKLATAHKARFYENAAVPNMAVKFDKDTSEDAFEEFVENFKAKHQGAWNAYKTLFLMGGADVEPLTMDFKQLEFSQAQGKGESRIASAAGVPPSWVGFSEGLQGSALNAGNFSSARRRFADGTIRPLWRMAAASLERLVTTPEGAQLWYDDRDIAFLREDAKDQAEIQRTQAIALRNLVDAGWTPDAAVAYLESNDMSRLVGAHSGLFSVQLQPPGTTNPNPPAQEDDDA
ncbi:phage portal protein [Prauserella flavalba]|uniref:phage portal protein n=1 Tax=Prauserella flavalba TaxID=1477506 RepID=UPI0036E8603D